MKPLLLPKPEKRDFGLILDGELRYRKPRWRPPYLRDVRRHIAAAWFLKAGYHFRWNWPLFKITRNLMRTFRACEIMAAWDIFLDEPRKSYDLYLLHSRMLSLMDHSDFKLLRDRYDKRLMGRRQFIR